MFSGLHFRGWIVMSLISVLLFTAVAVPAAYIPKTFWRTIYVAVVTPVVWVVYNVALYFVLCRPMAHCTSMFSRGECCKTKHADDTGDVTLLTKEMYQLNNVLHSLKCETAEMNAATTLINNQLDGKMADQSPQKGAYSSFTELTPTMRSP
ncbi:conserved hypothetical protein [Leishmania infantum JPCM5]|uniref:Uncharacterized protein n=3 Tax=Leishmania donovani species complex TaxID=38574 RepID=A4IB84_LEIIN|nr:conserved hypothetical protein [Leishmania infantum JPCM5]XP_003864766.1 hypothetical protein, conserved [Leishmania donovani]CAC9544287.1 hypothetical_protein_-_conserved [Leishmania infantum]AYU82982.1 hypothetical protein LdCL_350023200 [Leishmania donovani]TPP44451.1 hypothetical protein CGC21_6420 [Leishmania donovani]CAM72098.1 conserved hypothetical protein [Leishmania infantum JPCM5]CBZ38086.1 hypothetical protein, conserved [Leishmania donovani]|eukprot:XP_001469003.1 conserved hypothetical protein [Leishmania infantum JPCM5]